MNRNICPLCYSELETRQVSPCFRCGTFPSEMECLQEKKHSYAEYQILNERFILCDFCIFDWHSDNPKYYGLKTPISQQVVDYIRPIDNPQAILDKYCSSCRKRFASLKFIKVLRDKNDRSRTK